MGPFSWAALGVILSFSIFLATVVFHTGRSTGKLESRMDELERWRGTIRQDMHEISDRIEALGNKTTELTGAIHGLTTLINERTDRRDWSTRKQS